MSQQTASSNRKAGKPARPPNGLYTLLEAAAHLRVSEKTMRRMLKAGEIAYSPIGKLICIEPGELAMYVASKRVERKQ